MHRAVGCEVRKKTDVDTCERSRALCIRCQQRHAHVKIGSDGQGLDEVDRYKDGSVGICQVTKMSSLFDFLLFMSQQRYEISSNEQLPTCFDTFVTWHAICWIHLSVGFFIF